MGAEFSVNISNSNEIVDANETYGSIVIAYAHFPAFNVLANHTAFQTALELEVARTEWVET